MKTPVKTLAAVTALCAVLAGGNSALGHCEIPCGIYGDRTQIDLLEEHIRTVDKSMKQIISLQKKPAENANQLVRWIVNKEEHANKIQEIVYQYFMNQRITPVDADGGDKYTDYVTKITLLHRMLVQSMKCKQTTDSAHIKELRNLLDRFEKAYFAGKEHKHN